MRKGKKGQLISVSDDQSIRIWDPQQGTLTHTLKDHTGPIHHLDDIGNGHMLSYGDGTIRIWSAENGHLVHMVI